MNRVTTDTRRLDNLIRNSNRNARDFVKAVGFQIEALAKMKAPVDTGALRSSIYTATNTTNNPPAISEDVEREQLPNPSSDLVVYVGPSVEYAIYQELGTSYSAPQPFMVPALREVERQIEANARILINE